MRAEVTLITMMLISCVETVSTASWDLCPGAFDSTEFLNHIPGDFICSWFLVLMTCKFQ